MNTRSEFVLTFCAIILAITTLISCSVSDSEDGEYSKWNYAGNVVDAENNLKLGGVEITYQSASGEVKTVFTDDSGYFFIEGLPYGTRTFRFSYKDVNDDDTLYYAPHVESVNSTSESSHMEGVVASNAAVIKLSPLSGSIKGELYIQEENFDNAIPVKNASLTLVHGDDEFINLFPESFSATTDSLGKFCFKNLPADTGLVLKVSPTSYKDLRYTIADIAVPRLKSSITVDLGRTLFERDTLIKKEHDVTFSNVMDQNYKGYGSRSPLIIPYYVFKEEISSNNLFVEVRSDSAVFYVEPKINKDTLFLTHADSAFTAETRYTVKIDAFGKKSETRYSLEFSGDSAFTTDKGFYAVASNAWVSHKDYKASFSINDTIWIKFNENLDKNVERVQWNYAENAARTIYAHSYGKNADSWIKDDTLFIQMQERILDTREQGDSIGMNITAYSERGLVLKNFALYTELQVNTSTSKKIVATNVASIQDSLKGYKVSPQIVPYYVFDEAISGERISVDVLAGSDTFYVYPKVNKDTLFLTHDLAFPSETKITVNMVVFGQKSGTRMAYNLSGDSAFVTNREFYAVTSNTWPSNPNYKANFKIESDTMWVKFSKKLSTNVDRVQWSKNSDSKYTLYGHGVNANATAKVREDTLFIVMEKNAVSDTTKNGDSFGMNLTVYAADETYINGLKLQSEYEIEPKSSTSAAASSTSETVASSSSTTESSSSAAASSSETVAPSSSETTND